MSNSAELFMSDAPALTGIYRCMKCSPWSICSNTAIVLQGQRKKKQNSWTFQECFWLLLLLPCVSCFRLMGRNQALVSEKFFFNFTHRIAVHEEDTKGFSTLIFETEKERIMSVEVMGSLQRQMDRRSKKENKRITNTPAHTYIQMQVAKTTGSLPQTHSPR